MTDILQDYMETFHPNATGANDSVFPYPEAFGNPINNGLSKRELFAAMAMQGLCANPTVNFATSEVERLARKRADGLISELNRDDED